MKSCQEAILALDTLEQFVSAQRNKAIPLSLNRDERFLKLAREALTSCTEENLVSLLEEMRGLSHYFGSYCSDMRQLDKLTGDLYRGVRNALDDLRS